MNIIQLYNERYCSAFAINDDISSEYIPVAIPPSFRVCSDVSTDQAAITVTPSKAFLLPLNLLLSFSMVVSKVSIIKKTKKIC